MKNFKRIINDIYPNPLVGFLFTSLIALIANIVIYVQALGIHYLHVVVFFVWGYVFLNFIVLSIIRGKIFRKFKSSRTDLIDYLSYRYRIEKAKSQRRRLNPNKTYSHEKIKELLTIIKRKRDTR